MTGHDRVRAGRLLRLALAAGPAPIRIARRAIREHGAIQRTWELASLVARVRRLAPRTVVEIGTHRGGSLYCWARAAADDAHLVSIDIPTPEEGLGADRETDRRLAMLLRPGQRLTCIRADSHALSTRAELVAALGGRPVDFLWIDGDHSDAGVRADWAMYAPLVRPGGLVAFHDIHPDPAIPGNQVHPLWRELRRAYPVAELIDQDQPGGVGTGIGVIAVPAGGLRLDRGGAARDARDRAAAG